jgi:hypothetical protein
MVAKCGTTLRVVGFKDFVATAAEAVDELWKSLRIIGLLLFSHGTTDTRSVVANIVDDRSVDHSSGFGKGWGCRFHVQREQMHREGSSATRSSNAFTLQRTDLT